MGKYIIGIDAGTTGIRAIAFDHDSNMLSNAYSEFTQYFPESGWVEHDANEIYDVTMAMIRQCVEEGGLSFDDLAAIGITNQRETTVVGQEYRERGMSLYRLAGYENSRPGDSLFGKIWGFHVRYSRKQPYDQQYGSQD